jgi:hypothetical protein
VLFLAALACCVAGLLCCWLAVFALLGGWLAGPAAQVLLVA